MTIQQRWITTLKWLLGATVFWSCLSFAFDVEVKGLFSGQALLQIDGSQTLLKKGQTKQGVTLISADSKQAVVEIGGQRHSLGMSRKIALSYSKPKTREFRIPRGRGGHYWAEGSINGRPVTMLVDTGATSIAMSLPHAQALGVHYRAGTRTKVSTANGYADAYRVVLDKVSVGGIEVRNVAALVNMGDFPSEVLLGNSYLQRLKLTQDSGVLIMESLER